MAHFYGTLQGHRGEASRLGSKSAGLRTYAASWQGAVSVRLWHDARTNTDMAEVSLTRHTNGAGTERRLYFGPVSGMAPDVNGHTAECQQRTTRVCICPDPDDLTGVDDPKAARALARRGGA